MSFNRNQVQEFIESEVGCLDISRWSSFKSALSSWKINAVNIQVLNDCVANDSISYFYKALVSFCQALNEIRNHKFAWSIVKIYYSVFYLCRCDLLLNNYIVVRCGSLYYAEVAINNSLSLYRSQKFKGDHQLTFGLIEKLHDASALVDPLLGNKIDEQNVYMWLLKHRERVNYQMRDFSDPYCDEVLNHVIYYFENDQLESLFQLYNNDTTYIMCFDMDHALLSIPFKKLSDTYKVIKSRFFLSHLWQDKKKYILRMMLETGLSKNGVRNLIPKDISMDTSGMLDDIMSN